MSKSFKKSQPSVKPTKYGGNPLKWLDWNGLFTATVQCSDMRNAEEVTHLQTHVIGPAKNLIRENGFNGDFFRRHTGQTQKQFWKAA